MDYDILVKKINVIKQIDKDIVLEHMIDKQNLFLFNPDKFEYANNMLKSHFNYSKNVQQITEKLLDKMYNDVKFRNFMCVDFQYFISDNERHRHPFIEKEETGTKDIYRIKYFGFLNKNSEFRIDDEEKQNWMINLTEHYTKQLKHLFHTEIIDFEENILRQVKTLKRILSIPEEHIEIDNENCILFDCKSPLLQDFLGALQFHIFYEEYVNSIISKTTGLKIMPNPVIFINPWFHSAKREIHGYIELDGFLYVTKSNNIIFVECKNSYTLRFDHLTQFIGKCNFIEKIYGIDIYKCLVSTGLSHPFYTNLGDYPCLNKILFFDLKDHQNNYVELQEFLSNL